MVYKDISNFVKTLVKLKFLNQDKSNQSETFPKKTSRTGLFNELRISSIALQIRKLWRFEKLSLIMHQPNIIPSIMGVSANN